ncbi:hypothetical protein BC938DRAFT_476494 [Jimgerdemannia flammicorona]|uniref:Uncharacterized protein n=1 Tax=Jimgerdemannia flammicorona TaxID=994334 RepID=A0A433QQF6_9FUNG|nr:hypothetical protein BC938DRAFT_476494 [Jimgerdemannia flammicorona]
MWGLVARAERRLLTKTHRRGLSMMKCSRSSSGRVSMGEVVMVIDGIHALWLRHYFIAKPLHAILGLRQRLAETMVDPHLQQKRLTRGDIKHKPDLYPT